MANVSVSANHDDKNKKKIKDALDDAIQSRLNVQFLSNMQEGFDKREDIRSFMLQKYPGKSTPEKLINQSHFLGHAYMCLVWLREAIRGAVRDRVLANSDLKKDQERKEIVEQTLKNCDAMIINTMTTNSKYCHCFKNVVPVSRVDENVNYDQRGGAKTGDKKKQ